MLCRGKGGRYLVSGDMHVLDRSCSSRDQPNPKAIFKRQTLGYLNEGWFSNVDLLDCLR